MSEKVFGKLPLDSNSSFLLDLCDNAIADFDKYNYAAIEIETHKKQLSAEKNVDTENLLVPKLRLVDNYVILLSYNIPGSRQVYFCEARDKILDLKVTHKKFRGFNAASNCFRKDCISILFALNNLMILEDNKISMNKFTNTRELQLLFPNFSVIKSEPVAKNKIS